MTNARTIDSHTHILTEEAMVRLAKESPLVAPALKEFNGRDATLEIAGKVVQQPLPREIWDVGLRLRDMDANQVDVQVLSPTVFTFFYGHDAALPWLARVSRTRRLPRSCANIPSGLSASAACRCRRHRPQPTNSNVA